MDINDDLLHFSNMIVGCESINSVLKNGGKLSYEGRYAQTVLKLHAEDAGFVAGTEGFLDSVKKGASNVKEWIMKILKAIKDWVVKVFNHVVVLVKHLVRDPNHEMNKLAAVTILNPLKNLAEVYKGFTDNNQEKYISSNTILITIDKINKVVKELEKDSNAKGSVIWPNVQTILSHIDDDVKDLAHKADAAANNVPSDLSDPSYDELSKEAMTVSSMCKDLVSAANSLTSSILRMNNKAETK